MNEKLILEKVQKKQDEEKGKTIKQKIKIISNAITENSTLTDILSYEDFFGSITLQVEPDNNRITRIEYHFVDRIDKNRHKENS